MVRKGEIQSATCSNCGEEYKKLGLHWSRGSCEYPIPDPHIDEILTGLYMGDGSLAAHGSDNPYLRWNNTNKPFLEYLDGYLGWLTTGVRKKKSADQAAKERMERDDVTWELTKENFNAIYGTRTRRLPYFRKFLNWSDGEQKRYPDTLELTPAITKFWYVSDGTVNWMRDYSARVAFACQNEQDRPTYIRDLFSQAGLEVKRNQHMYYLSVEESRQLLEWMGDPVPGYEYKWEIDSRENYESLFRRRHRE